MFTEALFEKHVTIEIVFWWQKFAQVIAFDKSIGYLQCKQLFLFLIE